jgi:hypothetical protein
MQLFFYSRSRYERTPVVGGLKTSLVNRAAGDRPCFMFSTAAASKLARELRLSCLELRQGFVPRLPSLVTFASLGYPTKTPALPGPVTKSCGEEGILTCGLDGTSGKVRFY